MATVSALIRQVSRIVDDALDSIDIIDWMNQCNTSISDITYLPTYATVEKSADGRFHLPLDYNGELKILVPQGIEVFSVYSDTIRFIGEESVSTIDITYNRLLRDITNNPDELPELPAQFHSIYVPYCAMQVMHPEEEPTRYAQYEREYMRLYDKLRNYMGKTRPKPARWAVVR